MNPDPASLDNLRDIVELPPVPWWPPAPGWWVLLTMAVVATFVVAWRVWAARRAAAYRRAALRELESATSVATIAEILKRTALVAYPRTDVASLSGSAWSQWLAETGGREVPHGVVEVLRLECSANTIKPVYPKSRRSPPTGFGTTVFVGRIANPSAGIR